MINNTYFILIPINQVKLKNVFIKYEFKFFSTKIVFSLYKKIFKLGAIFN